MTNKTHTVLRDLCSETKGTPSTVGQEVSVVVKIPALHPVIIYDGDRPDGISNVRYAVYLTQGALSRINQAGVVVERVFVARVDGTLYQGNDVYTAEELGISE